LKGDWKSPDWRASTRPLLNDNRDAGRLSRTNCGTLTHTDSLMDSGTAPDMMDLL
jgi:hypothetical protein